MEKMDKFQEGAGSILVHTLVIMELSVPPVTFSILLFLEDNIYVSTESSSLWIKHL